MNDCIYCNQKWPRLHVEHLYEGEPHVKCRASSEHAHLHRDGKRPYEDRRPKRG